MKYFPLGFWVYCKNEKVIVPKGVHYLTPYLSGTIDDTKTLPLNLDFKKDEFFPANITEYSPLIGKSALETGIVSSKALETR